MLTRLIQFTDPKKKINPRQVTDQQYVTKKWLAVEISVISVFIYGSTRYPITSTQIMYLKVAKIIRIIYRSCLSNLQIQRKKLKKPG